MIGTRLKLARAGAGLSLRALAERAGHCVSAQAIGKYERDEMMPSSTALLALAGALEVSPDFLVSQREITLSGLEFRRAPSASSKEEKMVVARVLEHMERYATVEKALALRRDGLPLAALGRQRIKRPDDAFVIADVVRRHWHLGTDPIPSMTELLEERGINVIALPLPSAVSGSKVHARMANGEIVAGIIINSSHTGERQRFTLAHELGHLVVDVSGSLTARAAEKAMDRFAGAFLVPDEELRRVAGQHRSTLSLGEMIELKAHFKVSLQCLALRLGQTKILSDAAVTRLWQHLKSQGFFDPPAFPEPLPVEPEASHRLHRLAMRAVSEGAMSEPKAAEILQVPVRLLGRWLEEGAHPAVQ